jgi:hypothetical protein
LCGRLGGGQVHSLNESNPCDDKSNCDHEPDDREQENGSDDLIAGKAHCGRG